MDSSIKPSTTIMTEENYSLVTWFYVDKLRESATNPDPTYLEVVRQIIFKTKEIQLEKISKADNEMMIEVLEQLTNQKKKEYEIALQHLLDAKERIASASPSIAE